MTDTNTITLGDVYDFINTASDQQKQDILDRIRDSRMYQDFRVGQRVSWTSTKGNRTTYVGLIEKVNRKTLHVEVVLVDGYGRFREGTKVRLPREMATLID